MDKIRSPIRGGLQLRSVLTTMNARKLATASTIGTFIVASLTGLLLFFEFGPGSVRATHEWMSIVFLGAAALHVYVNQKPFVNYFKKHNAAPLLAGLILGMAIFIAAFNDIYAAEAVFHRALNSGLEDVVILFDVNAVDAIDMLQAEGIDIESPTQTIADIAATNGLEVYDVIEPLLKINDR